VRFLSGESPAADETLTIVPPPRRLEIRVGRLNHEERAGEVDRQDSFPIGGRHGFDIGVEINACGVYDAIESAKSGGGSLNGARYGGLIGDIDRGGVSESLAQTGRQRCKGRCIAVDRGDTRAFRRELAERREPNPLGGASHQDASSMERPRHCLAARAFSSAGRMSSTISSQRPIQTLERFNACPISPSRALSRDGWPMSCGCMPIIIMRSSA
jgi:hypothetical protein